MHAGKQVNTHFTLHTHAVSKAPGFTHAVSHKALSQSRNSTHALSHARTFTRTHFHTHELSQARTFTRKPATLFPHFYFYSVIGRYNNGKKANTSVGIPLCTEHVNHMKCSTHFSLFPNTSGNISACVSKVSLLSNSLYDSEGFKVTVCYQTIALTIFTVFSGPGQVT